MNEHTHLEDLTDRIKPRTASNVLLWVVVGFVVVFIIWAALTELDRTVRGQGRVIASSQLQVVSNLEGGIVEAILVRTGQQVKAGPGAGPARPDRRPAPSSAAARPRPTRSAWPRSRGSQAEVAGREPAYPAAGRPGGRRARSTIERSLHASRMAELGSLVNAGQAARRPGQPRRRTRPQAAYRRPGLGARRPRSQELEPDPAAGRARDRAAPVADPGRERHCGRGQRGRRRRGGHLARPLGGRRGAVRRSPSSARTGARSPPTSSPPPRPNIRPRRAAAAGARRARSSAPWSARRCRAGSTGCSSPPSAAPSARARRWSRSCRREETLLVEAMVRPQDIAWVRMGQKAKVNITAYDLVDLRLARRRWSPPSRPTRRSTSRPARASTRSRCGPTKNALDDRDGRPLPIGTGMVADVSLLGDKRTDPQLHPQPDHQAERDALSASNGRSFRPRTVVFHAIFSD